MALLSKKRIPITLLCGYLGAGKTTLLNRVLNNQQGYKVAVIVNDIGEVNVDASLIAKGGNITDTSDIVPLTNGCICCTLKSQMAANIEKLIRTGRYDYILIEASGVCEPMPIAQELELIRNGQVDNVVGVVDAARLVDEFAGGENLLKKDSIEEEDVESLLIQQIEFCSTLVINKTDLVSEAELAKVRKVIRALHPGVRTIETHHGDVPVGDILATGSFNFDSVYAEAGWCRALEEGELGSDDDELQEVSHEHDEHGEHHGHHHHDDDDDDDGHDEHGHHHEHHHEHRHEGESEDEYGIGTFIYYRRVPFNRKKLSAYVNTWPRDIIRSKGLVWFGDEYDTAYVFETSGRQLLCGPYGRWVAAAPARERDAILAANPQIIADWDGQVGDRMVRLCIIGKNLDRKGLSEALDACLESMDK